MALQYKKTYDEVSKIGDREIHFRPWTSKEERNYLKLIEKNDNISELDFYNTLIRPCVKDDNLMLSQAEQKKLLLDIRIKSISPFIEDTIECECGHTDKIKVKIKDCTSYTKSNFCDIQEKDVRIEFKQPDSIEKLFSVEEGESIVDYIYDMFILHIDKIIIKEEGSDTETVHSGISELEKREFIDSLPSKMFDVFFERFQDMLDETKVEYTHKCSKCSKTKTIDYNYIPNLLWV